MTNIPGRIRTFNLWLRRAKDVNTQHPVNTILTESTQSILASCLAQIVQEYPELPRLIETLIEAYATLPKQTKTKITDLIEKHIMERKADGSKKEND